jgi:hypothetical protein
VNEVMGQPSGRLNMRARALLACALSCVCGARTAWDTATLGGGDVLLPDGGDADALFVGTWKCANSVTITTTESRDAHFSDTDLVTIVENANGTLTLGGKTVLNARARCAVAGERPSVA